MSKEIDSIVELQLLHLEEQGRKFDERRSKINPRVSSYAIIWNQKNTLGYYFTQQTDFGDLNRDVTIGMYSGGNYFNLGKASLVVDDKGLRADVIFSVTNEKQISIIEAVNLLIEKHLVQMTVNPDRSKMKHKEGQIVSGLGEFKYWPVNDIEFIPIPSGPQ